MPAMHAYADDFGVITIWMKSSFYGGRSDYFYLTSRQGLYMDLIIKSVEDHPDAVKYLLTTPADLPFGIDYRLHESHGLSVPVEMRLICQKPFFTKEFMYDGNDLGPIYHPLYTLFSVWAPTAVSVILKLDNRGSRTAHPMTRTDHGVWRARVNGDLRHATYTYLVNRNGQVRETLDPYALSSTANGHASAVIDPNLVPHTHIPCSTKINSAVDAIIYECSVRDMTSSAHSGTSTHGTFDALCEENTSWKGHPTGMSYLASLGVTHVQLMPVLDFVTVDEEHPSRNYNWGYDPAQYLTVEGSYSSDPDDPYARMKELRMLVDTFHRHDMRVTLDVVFNHMYDVDSSPFQCLTPYYWFRYNDSGYLSNGSYCGNDLSSTQPMVRKYFVDVCTKLMDLYDVDGFRFDLMGVLDVDTMNAIHDAVKARKPDALLYGEGWDMPTMLAPEDKACIVNQNRMPDIGHFNDYFRDTVKGRTSDDQKYAQGYITGDLGMAFGMCSAVTGNVIGDPYFYRFDSPCKTINGTETHDNATSWDKMRACCSSENHDTRLLRQKMLLAATLFSIGVPFLHAGQEFCGTKNNVSNSYNAGDGINQMDWDRAIQNQEIVAYTRRAIALRREYKAFHYATQKEVCDNVHVSVMDGNVVVCDIHCPDPEHACTDVRILYNPSYDNREYGSADEWQVIFDHDGNPQAQKSSVIYVPGLSVIVAVKNNPDQ